MREGKNDDEKNCRGDEAEHEIFLTVEPTIEGIRPVVGYHDLQLSIIAMKI